MAENNNKDQNLLILNLVKQVKSIAYQLAFIPVIDESKYVHIHGDETIFDFKTFVEIVTAFGFAVPGGTADQFLKADGSVDTTIYEPLLGFIPEDSANKGVPDGYASLDNTGKVPSSQLPSYVDDVLEFPTLADFPNPGEHGIIYVALDTNKTYRWSGSTYIEISSSEVDSVFGRIGAVVAEAGDYDTSLVPENGNLYYTEARVSANVDVAANTAARHAAVTLGVANGLGLAGQVLSMDLASATTTGTLTAVDWNKFNNKESAFTNANIIPKGSAAGLVNSNISDSGTLVTVASNLTSTGTVLSSGFKVTGPVGYLKSDGTVDTSSHNTGLGTVNSIPLWTGTSVLGDSPLTVGTFSTVRMPWANGGPTSSSFGFGFGPADYFAMWIATPNAFLMSSTRNHITGTTGSAFQAFMTNNVERGRFTIAGNFLVGTTVETPGYILKVGGNILGGNILADKFITQGGLPTDFVKGDGSLDSSVYITEGDASTLLHNDLLGLQGGKPNEYYHLDNSQLGRVLALIYVNSINSLAMLTPVSEKGVSTAVSLQYNIKTNDDVFIAANINQGVGSVLSGINLGNQTKAAGNWLATTTFTLSMDYTRNGTPVNETKTATYTAVVPKWSNVSATAIIDTYALCVANLGAKNLSVATALNNTGSAANQYIWFISTSSTGQIFDGNNFSQSIGPLNVEDGVSEFYKKSFVLTLQDSTTATVYSYRTRTLKTFSGNIYRIT